MEDVLGPSAAYTTVEWHNKFSKPFVWPYVLRKIYVFGNEYITYLMDPTDTSLCRQKNNYEGATRNVIFFH